MEIFIVSVFVLGYLAITLEHSIKIDKLIPALIMMALAWAGIAFGLDNFTTWFDSHHGVLVDGFKDLPMEGVLEHGHEVKGKSDWMESTLLHHFGKTAEILIFLVGAMTIVEIVDHFNGFQTMKRIIKTKKKSVLLWVVSILGFCLSAVIDNLTATIVLITILRKIIHDNELRMYYAGMIIIAANAGGAWSPIGDVTTTMLWMGEKVSAGGLVQTLLLPSIVCLIVPLGIASFLPVFKGSIAGNETEERISKNSTKMLIIGLVMIIFVPIFKTVTHLPPYIGMMLSLAIVSLIAEFLTHREFSLTAVEDHNHVHGPTFKALSKIEMPSILFFLGILMTVAALESLGMIFLFGNSVVDSGLNIDLFITLLGGGSAVIDNVPLVAASMGMFQEPMDSPLWHFIAYAAGTGGSMLIIGSAAGVVAMGMEKISFFWYVKKISWLAVLGYLAGVGVFLLFK
jgi:Na+/H+ antiporter NhaD/arsenite permease-like protein